MTVFCFAVHFAQCTNIFGNGVVADPTLRAHFVETTSQHAD